MGAYCIDLLCSIVMEVIGSKNVCCTVEFVFKFHNRSCIIGWTRVDLEALCFFVECWRNTLIQCVGPKVSGGEHGWLNILMEITGWIII